MRSREKCLLLFRAAAVSAAVLTTQSAGTVDVEPDAMQGRTAAAIADFRAAAELEPDLKHGASLFATCAECHGTHGRGSTDGSIPAIAEQHVSVLVKQLVDFRHDRRWDERMQEQASKHNLSGPQDLLDVAAYAESLPRGAQIEGGIGDGTALERGKVIYHRSCAACHGPLGLGELRRMRPRLAGQHYRYLARQLEDTAAGRRPAMDAEHVKLVGVLSPEERSGVADYLSRLSPDLVSTRDNTP
jgi:cytochrome c553